MKIPCKFCNSMTAMTGTGMCDNCFEVSSRISSMPLEVLNAILADLANKRPTESIPIGEGYGA